MKRYEDADRAYKKAAALNSKNGKYYRGIGESQLRLGNRNEAIAAFRRAQQLDQADAKASERLGDIFSLQKDYADAVTDYGKALQYNSRNNFV